MRITRNGNFELHTLEPRHARNVNVALESLTFPFFSLHFFFVFRLVIRQDRGHIPKWLRACSTTSRTGDSTLSAAHTSWFLLTGPRDHGSASIHPFVKIGFILIRIEDNKNRHPKQPSQNMTQHATSVLETLAPRATPIRSTKTPLSLSMTTAPSRRSRPTTSLRTRVPSRCLTFIARLTTKINY